MATLVPCHVYNGDASYATICCFCNLFAIIDTIGSVKLQIYDMAQRLGSAFVVKGLEPRDGTLVGIYSSNCPEVSGLLFVNEG